MARVRHWSRPRPPKGWLDVGRQLVLFFGAYYVYTLVRGMVNGEVPVAFAHARSLVGLEQRLGLFFEPHLQHWALGRSWIVDIANWIYLNSQFTITVGFLLWLYFARNSAFYYVRNMFLIAMALALVGYVAFPAAPPRLLPEWGFTDTVASWLGSGATNTASILYNPFAAVPSVHVAFALMIAVPAIRLVRSPLLRFLWGTYPVMITFVVLVTANHFWLDAAFGALVAGVAAYTAKAALGRARPEEWSWPRALGAKAAA